MRKHSPTHTHAHTHIHTHTHTRTQTQTHTHTQIYTHTYIHTYTCAHTHTPLATDAGRGIKGEQPAVGEDHHKDEAPEPALGRQVDQKGAQARGAR